MGTHKLVNRRARYVVGDSFFSGAVTQSNSDLLNFGCSGFALLLFCMCALSLSPFQREPFLRSASLGQGAILDH
jgi:hypothetical protein